VETSPGNERPSPNCSRYWLVYWL